MSIVKIRELSKYGILTDPDPFDLPVQAFSDGVNVSFRDGRVQRAPVFRTAATLDADPRHVVTLSDVTDVDNIFVAYKNGQVHKWTFAAEVDQSPSGYVDSDAETPYTSCELQSVLYINRSDREPWSLLPADTEFDELANWTSTWRCAALRTYNDALIALNVTKGGAASPKMVKTSSIAEFGLEPTSWDHTTPGTNATENTLGKLKAPLVDGLGLRDSFILYTTKETWVMQATGDVDVYAYRPLFSDAGMINQNCGVEVDNVHYVFGTNDIWMHDGNSKRSIVDGRVRKRIFSSINAAKASQCFVTHNPFLKTISFNYVASTPLSSFIASDMGCNYAAVYHLEGGVWSFEDRPYVFASSQSALTNNLTWATVSATWASIGGTWADLEDGLKKATLYVGGASSGHGLSDKLYCQDLFGEGSQFTLNVDEDASRPLQLFRDGIDLDEVGVDLRGYKQINAVYPQGRVDLEGDLMEFSFGAADGFNEAAVFSDYQTFNGRDLYKVDFRDSGRYLSMRLRHQGYRTMSLSGLDLDLMVTGNR